MLGLAFVAVGSFCRRSFASASIRFHPSGSFFPCTDVLSSCGDFFGSHAPPGLPLLLPPSRQKGRMRRGGGEGLGMPLCCFPRAFLSSRPTFVQREGWRSLWSLVRCTRARFCLLGWIGWLSLLISARPAR